MSSVDTHELQCPKCGNTQQTAIWDSINVKLNPELKKALLDGRINMFHCDKCQEEAFVNLTSLSIS